MKRSPVFAVAFVLVLLGTVSGSRPTGAKEPLIDFTIGKFTCPTDPGNVSLAAGNIPDECDPSAGVAFTLAMPDGTDIGSCVTDSSGICKVQVPNEATVTVTEVVSTAPAGFSPRENPITTQAVTEFAGALFINLPTTQPPVVGVGTAAARGGVDSTLAMTILLSLVLASIAVLWRRLHFT